MFAFFPPWVGFSCGSDPVLDNSQAMLKKKAGDDAVNLSNFFVWGSMGYHRDIYIHIHLYVIICIYMYNIYIHKYDFISKNLHMYTIWYYFFFPSASTEIGSLLLEDPKNDQPGSFLEVKIGLDMPKATLKRPITIKLWHWTHIKHVSTQCSYILINHSFCMFLLYGGFLHVSGLCRKHTSLLDIIGLFSFLVSM